MKVAVITPYWSESEEILKRCSDSLKKQTHGYKNIIHVMVSDRDPKPDEFIESLGAHHIKLPFCSNDHGDTARGIGAISAVNSGCDAICFLDGDNWFYPEHIEYMLQITGHGYEMAVARRDFYRPDGIKLPIVESTLHVDTNCLFLTGKAMHEVFLWAMKPKIFYETGDRIFWLALNNRGHTFGIAEEPSVGYETMWKKNYTDAGIPPPAGCKDGSISGINKWYEESPEEEKEWWSKFIFGEKGKI